MTHKAYESLLTQVLKKAIRLEMRVSINFFLTNQFNYASKYLDVFGGQSSVLPLAKPAIRT